MKIESLLFIALFAAPVPSRAANPNPTGSPTGSPTAGPTANPTPNPTAGPTANPSPGGAHSPFAAVNAAIEKVRLACNATQECFKGEQRLRSDYSGRKAQYLSEFKGTIPLDLIDLLFKKMERIRKVHDTCLQQYKELGKGFEWVMQVYGAVEPKGLNLDKQKDAINALRGRYRSLQSKGPAQAPESDE
jgi:hypothetical protein